MLDFTIPAGAQGPQGPTGPAGSYGSQSSNTVLAGPTSGSSSAPALRALVVGDIPSLTSLYDAAGAASTAQNNAESFASSTIAALPTVVHTGSYSDLTNKPTLGTAAAQNSTAFDSAGAAASAQSAAVSVAETYSANASHLSSGAVAPSLIGTIENVSFSATPAFSLATLTSQVTLVGNITSFTLSAGSDGQLKILTFCQDSVGGYTVSGAPATVRGFFTVGSIANKCSSETFYYSVAQSSWLPEFLPIINQ